MPPTLTLPAAGRSIRIAATALDAIRAHASRAYPEECCGALLGRDVGGTREVAHAIAAENRAADARDRRYRIPASDVRVLEARAAALGLDVVGFYHSHPDGGARPSATDRRLAWPWYSYLIVPVAAAGAGCAARGWRLRDDRSGFEEERVIGVEEGAWT